jgi:hypothetical protein
MRASRASIFNVRRYTSLSLSTSRKNSSPFASQGEVPSPEGSPDRQEGPGPPGNGGSLPASPGGVSEPDQPPCHLAPGPQEGPQALPGRRSCGAQGDGGDGRKEQCGWAGGRPANIAGRPAESMEQGLHEGRVPPGGVVLPSQLIRASHPSQPIRVPHPSHASESLIRDTHPSRTSESYVRVKWASAVGTTLDEGRAPPRALHARMHACTPSHEHARTHAHMHARTHARTRAHTIARAHTHVPSMGPAGHMPRLYIVHSLNSTLNGIIP